MPVPVPATWTVGEHPTAAKLNINVRDTVNFLLNPPAVLVYNGAIAIATAPTVTYATFSSERYDTENIHDPATPSRLICRTPGIYTFDLYVLYAGSALGSQRSAVLRRNGTQVIRQADVPQNAGVATAVPLSTTYKLDLNDYVELGMYQDTGGVLNATPEFGMTWIGVG